MAASQMPVPQITVRDRIGWRIYLEELSLVFVSRIGFGYRLSLEFAGLQSLGISRDG